MREWITTGNIDKIIDIMSEQKEEVKDILNAVLQDSWLPKEQLRFLLTMDDMNLRGDQVSLIYQNYCHADIATFVQLIQTRDANMITWINNTYTLAQAVTKDAYRFGKRQFPPHPDVAYIIDTTWKVLVQIDRRGYVVLVDSQKNERKVLIQYLDDNVFYVDGVIWHMCEFADMLMRNGYKCNPTLEATPLIKYRSIAYKVPRTKKEMKQHKKMIAEYK